MGKFKSNDGFGGFKKYGGDRDFKRGGGSDRPVNMHKAICSDCAANCEVPFRPTGDKPVFCSDCFAKKDTSNKSRNERRASNRQNNEHREMYRTVCSECGKNCEVPFRPTGDKPVFCSDCFGRGAKSERNSTSATVSLDYKKDFEMLNTKLDNILEILSARASVEKPIIELKAKLAGVKKVIEKKTKLIKEKTKSAPKKVIKKTVSKKKVDKKTPVKKKK